MLTIGRLNNSQDPFILSEIDSEGNLRALAEFFLPFNARRRVFEVQDNKGFIVRFGVGVPDTIFEIDLTTGELVKEVATTPLGVRVDNLQTDLGRNRLLVWDDDEDEPTGPRLLSIDAETG